MQLKIVLLTTFFLASCYGKMNKKPESPEPFVKLELSSESIKLGESVSILWTTENAEYCSLTANNETAELELNLTSGQTHSPEDTTTYRLECQGPDGRVVASEANVTVLKPGEVVVTLDSLEKVGKAFPLDEITELVCEVIEDCQLEDFSYERKIDLDLPQNKVVYVGMSESLFSLEGSVLYGLESNHDFDSYQQMCEETFGITEGDEIFSSQILSKSFEAGEEAIKTFRDESLVHLSNFKAVTKSFGDELPSGTGFDVSFQLATTEVSYTPQYEDFGEMTGSFAALDNTTIREASAKKILGPLQEISFLGRLSSMFASFVNEIKSIGVAIAATFPNGYPVPPSKNGYKYDPQHDTCNNPRPKVSYFVDYNSRIAFCSGESVACPDEYIYGGQSFPGLPSHFPHRVYKERTGQPFSKYVKPEPSLRVISAPGDIQCNTMFPALAQEYNLGSNWRVLNYGQVHYFVTDSRWPGCGSNCVNKVARSGASDNRHQNVEPYQNFCVDRWKGSDWNTYQVSLQAACRESQLFQAAQEEKNRASAIEEFIKACNGDRLCKDSLEAMRQLTLRFEAETLEKEISDTEKSYDKAFEAGKSFLLASDDPVFSRLSEVYALASAVASGSSKIDLLLRSTKADWNLAQVKITNIKVMIGFESSEARDQTIRKYQSLLERAEGLVTPVATKVSCDYKTTGRFRKYLKNDIKKIEQAEIDDALKSMFLRSISDLKADK